MASYTDRMARLRERMKAVGVDLVILGPSSHMAWLSGLDPHGDERPVLLVVGADKAGFLMPALNADSQRPLTDLPFFTWTDADGPDQALADLFAEIGADRPGLSVAIDETMRADFALLALGALKEPRHQFTQSTVGYLRARKDPGEYALLKENALLNDRAMEVAFKALKVGITEREVEQIIIDFYKANGAKPAFTIVCFGANGAFPHHHSGDTRLEENSAVLIDIGGRMKGYPSDMTRVGVFGTAPEGFGQIHSILEQAVKAAVAAARPGVPASTVDKAARDVITAAGYGPNFLHRTGHGLGIDVHEGPFITATSDTILEEGNVFSIEPGIYLPGRFGIRLEEIVILRQDGAEILSELSREPVYVG